MTENEISKEDIDAGLKVHKALGMSLYETVYEQCLAHELTKRGLYVELVENKVVIEVRRL